MAETGTGGSGSSDKDKTRTNKNHMVRVICPSVSTGSGVVWANSLEGSGYRCTKCGAEGHPEAPTK